MKKRKINNYPSYPKDEEIISKLSDPNYKGGNLALPKNPTPLQIAKYEICQSILAYQQDRNLSLKTMAKKIGLSEDIVEEILFCQIHKFTLDSLFSYAQELGINLKVNRIETGSKRKNLFSQKYI